MDPAVPKPPRGPLWREAFQVALASHLKAGYAPWLARNEATATANAMCDATLSDDESTWDRDVRAFFVAYVKSASPPRWSMGLRLAINAADDLETARQARRKAT